MRLKPKAHQQISFRTAVIILLNLGLVFVLALPIKAQNLPTVTSAETLLQQQIQIILDSGYLRPSYMHGHEFYANDAEVRLYGNNFNDFWHNPAETLYTLAAAYPYLNTTQQTQVRSYLQDFYSDYKPYQWSHMGMAPVTNGKRPLLFREPSDPPPAMMPSYDDLAQNYLISSYYWSHSAAQPANYWWDAYNFNPFNFYGLYQYAKVMGNASTILTALNKTPENYLSSFKTADYLKTHPFMLNLHIAGYYGYLGLQQLAGQNPNSTVQNYLNNAQALRLQHLREVDPVDLDAFEAGGFLYLVPELGQYLYTNDRFRVEYYVTKQSELTPYWSVARAEDVNRIKMTSLNEGAFASYYDYWGLFQAKAYALKESRSQLEGYLDVPVVPRGDLFYIQNLVAVIQADPNPPPSQPPTSPTQIPIDTDLDNDADTDWFDLSLLITNFNQLFAAADFNLSGLVDVFDFNRLIGSL